eukprot:Sdes_comp9707_c0_seq1m1205
MFGNFFGSFGNMNRDFDEFNSNMMNELQQVMEEFDKILQQEGSHFQETPCAASKQTPRESVLTPSESTHSSQQRHSSTPKESVLNTSSHMHAKNSAFFEPETVFMGSKSNSSIQRMAQQMFRCTEKRDSQGNRTKECITK